MSGMRLIFLSLATAVFISIAALLSCAYLPHKQLDSGIQDRLNMQDGKDAVLEADIKISMVGDIMLGGTAEEIFQKYGYNYAFDQTRHLLQRANIAFGNLEGPLATWGLVDPEKTWSYKSPPDESAAALKNAGFDIVSLANNHALDYGVTGLVQTMQALDREKINHVGGGMNINEARQARVLEVEGQRVAFLAYSLTFPESFWATDKHAGVAFGHQEHIVADVKAARKQADFVLVSVHWGRESTTELRPYQKSIGHAAIDAGASVVIGHHPHVLQAVEKYKQGIIFYSLGNFAFGSYSKKVDSSVVSHVYFKDNQLDQIRLWPIYVRNNDVLFQSKILDGSRASEVVKHLQEISAEFNTPIIDDNGTAVIFMHEPQGSSEAVHSES